MVAAPSVDSIRDSFPFPTLPTQNGVPTYETIKAIHMKLKSNAASIPSTLGGGNQGLLGLVLDDAVYHTFTGHHFTIPAYPGALPTIPTGSTAPQISEIVRQHSEQLRIFNEATRTDQALKQQLLGAYNEMYTRGLRNIHTGYSSVTTLTLLTHLYTSYGRITTMDLDTNDTQMRTPYDATQPIECLFEQIESGQEFAAAGNAPIPDTTLVNIAYLLLFKTGMYRDACRDWNRRATADKTWTNLKADMLIANAELRELQALNHPSGFQAPGESHHMNNIMDQYHAETSDVFRQIAAATESDRLLVANLAASNNTLQTDLNSMKEDMKKLLEKMSKLATNSEPTPRRNDTNESYCWTHGRTRNDNHTSASCNHKKDGHKDNATLHNKQGGSTRWCN